MKSLVQKLVEVPGPSGNEKLVREAIREEVQGYADQVFVDNLGNLVACKGQVAPGGKKIMLAAHMDEIGLIATHITEGGFVRFLPVGAILSRTCPAGRVRFLNGAGGVIGWERMEDLKQSPTVEQMFIDLGVEKREDCPVQIGDMAVFELPFMDLGDRIVAKALDDRSGVAVLIEALRRISSDKNPGPNQLFFVFSVQEEVGARGATAAAFHIEPDLGLAVDVTSTGDTPRSARLEVEMGKGPGIKVRDQGMLADPRIVEWMVKTAEKAGIPYQLEVLPLGSTDARSIQLSRAGVPAGSITIPCRYIHTPSEMIDVKDLEHTVQLLLELLKGQAPVDGWE